MRVHHIALGTRDVERLCNFYREVLGLEVAKEDGGSVWFEIGDAMLMIAKAPRGAADPDGSADLFAFGVNEAQRARITTRLVQRGIPLEDEALHTTYFRDPDGRRIAVSTDPLKTTRRWSKFDVF
jgi:catechol-2,3-dioxygenase